MELIVEKKIPDYGSGNSKIYLMYQRKWIFDVVYAERDWNVVNSVSRAKEAVVKEKRGWFDIKYYVVKNLEIFHFKIISSFRKHYQFMSNKNAYDIYGHKKFKYSIFENGLQIGYFIEASSSVKYNPMYQIVCNSDVDVPLIFSFLLVMTRYDNDNNDGAAFTYKMSPFWKTKKDFDEHWKPKPS